MTDQTLAGLWSGYTSARAAADGVPIEAGDEAAEAFYRQADICMERIERTPAATPDELRIKAMAALDAYERARGVQRAPGDEPDELEGLILSLIRDCERLAQGAADGL